MKSNEALTLLYSKENVRLTTEGWDNEAFITLVDGVVVNQDGEQFNIMKAKEDAWVEWFEPKVKTVLKSNEALTLLYSKENVRLTTEGWDNEAFITLVDGVVVNQDGEQFNIMKAKEDAWVEWFEPKAGNSDAIVSKLMERIEELLKENRDPSSKEKGDCEEDAHKKIMAVYGVDNPAEVKVLFGEALKNAKNKRDVQVAITSSIPYCWIGRTLGTTKTYYSAMRKIVNDMCPDEYREMALVLLTPPSREITKIVKGVPVTTRVGLYDHLKENEIKAGEAVYDDREEYDLDEMETVIAKVKDDILNENYGLNKQEQVEGRSEAYVKASYLALVTGRRMTEILLTVSLKNNEGDWVYDGLLKKKNDKDRTGVAFSLDDDFEFLAGLFDDVQEHVRVSMDGKEITEKTVASKFNRSFNNAFKRATGTNYTFKDAREIFADMLWRYEQEARAEERLEEQGQIAEEKFKAMVLEHEYDNKKTPTLSYMTKKGVRNDK